MQPYARRTTHAGSAASSGKSARALPRSCARSPANYLLFFHPDEALVPKLRETGVLLRDCRNFVGLCPGWYRAAVRTRPENEIFLQKLKEVL